MSDRIQLVIWMICAFLSPYSLRTEMVEIRHENFVIRYDSNDERSAKFLWKTLQKVNPSLQEFFHLKLSQRIVIYWLDRETDFQRMIPAHLPDWVQGFYLPEQKKIVLRRMMGMNQSNNLSEVLTHELSHLYLHQLLGDIPIPTWFNEGLAEYLTGKEINISEGVILANAIFSGQWLELETIDSLYAFTHHRAQLAYIESYTAVRFLERYIQIKELNWTNFFDIICAFGFEKALTEVSGMDEIDFEIKWYRDLKDKYQWFIIFNWENFIWITMVLILIGAMYAIRYRNRKILIEWDKEEVREEERQNLYHNIR